jgi:hypothetical protein
LQAEVEDLEQEPDGSGPEGQEEEFARSVLQERFMAQAIDQKVQHEDERPPEERVNGAVEGFDLREEKPVAQGQSNPPSDPEITRIEGDSPLGVRDNQALACSWVTGSERYRSLNRSSPVF